MNLFPMIILCGVKGTRLGSLTADTPKSLLIFNRKPFIQYQIELLKANGFNRIHLCLGKFASEIIDFFYAKSNFDIHITYSIDEPQLGTAGAMENALDMIDGEDFFVMYGDSYVDMNYRNMQIKYDNSAELSMMSVYKNNNKFDKSNVAIIDYGLLMSYQNRGVDLEYIDAGVSIYDKHIFGSEYLFCSYLPQSLKDIQGIISNFRGISEMAPYIIKNRFYEIGSLQGIEDFKEFIKKENL